MEPARQIRTAERWALRAFVLFTAVALVGYGVFGLHPERLAGLGRIAGFYTISFPFFARAHIVVAALVLGVPLALRLGKQWPTAALAGVLVIGVSLTAELVGTETGLPFGEYRYTGLLGPKVMGRVPALVPISWFLMALPSFGLASLAFPDSAQRPSRLIVATAALVAWDLALDPAMSRLAPYWIWEQTGPYYGMPWINLLGWTLTGFAIMGILETLGARTWSRAVPGAWWARYYGVTLAMPLGMMALAGLWVGVVVTMVATTVLTVVVWQGRTSGALGGRHSASPPVTSRRTLGEVTR